MKFYNRETELEQLQKIKRQSLKRSRMTVITGRRRIGKTRLITESQKGDTYLYFFIARKSETLLCEEFTELITSTLGINIFGKLTQFKDVFGLLMDHSEKHPLTVVIDEFQEFTQINPSVFSDMQNIWDRKKETTKMNLILSGSVYSLMKKIFENSKEPLFGRADEKLFIRPFSIAVQKKILTDIDPDHQPIDLLCFYMMAGGIPKYIEQFVDRECGSKDKMLNEMLRENSLFLEEGKNVLIEEFGKDYTTYFSILSLIASSKTSRNAMQGILEKDIGGYLSRLENDYQIIKKRQPIFAKPNSRTVKYYIVDNFLNFWFRFIYKNRGAVEIQNFDYIRQIIDRDFSTFSGHFLEKLVKEQLAATKEYSLIGSYWEKGNKNELDIVAINDLKKTALIGEVKLQEKNISIPQLQSKAWGLHKQLSQYNVEYRGFSLKDI